jgi:hypothetical protein
LQGLRRASGTRLLTDHFDDAPEFGKQGRHQMLLTIAAILLVLWVLGFAVFPIVGGLIHIILVIAIIVVILHFVRGRNI